MAIVRLHRNITNISAAGETVDYQFNVDPARGGILLGIELIWQPYTFLNIGTDEEVPTGGDIHVIVADVGTSQPVIGQVGITLTDSPIVVPAGGAWEWDHPYRDEIEAAAAMIEKLSWHGHAVMPAGILQNSLRIIAQREPVRNIAHSLVIQADLLVFDTNFY